MRQARSLVAGLVLLLVSGPAAAHSGSSTYSVVRIADDRTIDYSLRVFASDLGEPLGLDRAPEDTELRDGEGRLFAYVLARITISANGHVCPLARRGINLDVDRGRLEELRFGARCPRDATNIAIDYRLFFDLDARHIGQLQVTYRERTLSAELARGLGHFEWTLDLPPRSPGLLHFIVKGIDHIFAGYDHIAFLIAMVLIAAIQLQGETWAPRGLRPALGHIVQVVTAFTVAHSLTLVAAALDWISLPRQAVEVAIAGSILYVAAENIWLGETRRRWTLAFGFGLVHGLGFAAMLRPLLPPRDVILPLLSFNVGVELGQVVIVTALLPVLHFTARRNAGHYRTRVVLCGSGIIGLLGLLWLLERLFGVITLSHLLS